MTTLDDAKVMARNILNQLDISQLIKGSLPSIERGETLLREYTNDIRYLTHSYAVAFACKAYAVLLGEDADLYYLTGLLHDFDNERYPYQEFKSLQEHPLTGISTLRQEGLPDIAIHAILAHASILDIQFSTTLSKVLFAVDELSGFLVALRMVRPGKTLDGIEWKSIDKKLRDERFAAGCDRKNIYKGAELLSFDDEESFKMHVLRVGQVIEQQMGAVEISLIA